MRNLELSLLFRFRDQASAVAKRAAKEVEAAAKQAATASTTAAKQEADAHISLWRRVTESRKTLGIRSEQEIRAEINRTKEAYQALAQSGVASAREQARAAKAMKDQVRELNRELKGTNATWERVKKVGQVGAGVVAGAAAGAYVLGKPVAQARDYSLSLAYSANTAFAGKSLQERLAGKNAIRNYVKEAVDEGGGTREEALGAYTKLVGSGQFNAAESGSMLKRLMRFSSGNEVSASEAADMALAAKQFGYKPEQIETFFDQSVRSGQMGGFEVKDMSRWLARQSASASRLGMSGERDYAELLALNQFSRTTAGTTDEAGNNVDNLLRKVLSNDTVGDFKKQGIDLTGSMAKARAGGAGVIGSFMAAVDAVVMKDPKLAALTKQISATTDEGTKKELLKKQAKILEGTAIGKVLQDAQALGAYQGWANNKNRASEMIAASRADAAKGANADSWAMVADEAAIQKQRREAAQAEASDRAFGGLMNTIGMADKNLADYAKKYPELSGILVGAGTGIAALGAAAFSAAGMLALIGRGGLPGAVSTATTSATTATTSAAATGGASLTARLVGILGLASSVANFTTNEEDDEVLNGDARWAEIRKKYSQSTIDSARKAYQPWYEFGEGYAADNMKWIEQYVKDTNQGKVQPIVIQNNLHIDGQQIAESVNHVNTTQAGRS